MSRPINIDNLLFFGRKGKLSQFSETAFEHNVETKRFLQKLLEILQVNLNFSAKFMYKEGRKREYRLFHFTHFSQFNYV